MKWDGNIPYRRRTPPSPPPGRQAQPRQRGQPQQQWVPQRRILSYGVRFAAVTHLGDRVQCSGKVVEKLTHAGRPCARIELTAAKSTGEVTLAGEALVALD